MGQARLYAMTVKTIIIAILIGLGQWVQLLGVLVGAVVRRET